MASAGTPYRLVPVHFYPCLLIKEGEGEDGMKGGEEDKGEEWAERGGEEWEGGSSFFALGRKKKSRRHMITPTVNARGAKWGECMGGDEMREED